MCIWRGRLRSASRSRGRFFRRRPSRPGSATGPRRKIDEISGVSAIVDPAAAFATPVAPQLQRRPASPPTPAEAARNAATIALYKETIGANSPASFVWSGVETANPLTRDARYRWNAIDDQGLFDADRRARLIDGVRNLGVSNLRIGLANHEIDLDDPQSWARHDAFVGDLAAAGLNLSLDLHHFGVEDRFRSGEPETSYYLHPDWPKYFARFSREAFARYRDKIRAVTLINEPETTVGFNSQMWHGAFPGWRDPRHDRVYVERAFAIASAAVRARIAIEKELARTGGRTLFMHTEAAVWKPASDDFNRVVRFLPSDLILGKEWLFEIDLDRMAEEPLEFLAQEAGKESAEKRRTREWLLSAYVFATDDEDEQAERLEKLVGMIGSLRKLHERLAESHGKTMRDDTVFAADYYAHNEAKGASGAWLSPEPQLYAAQAAVGERRGLYQMIRDYHDRYRMPMMIGETGTPFYAYGARWHAEMLLETAAAMEDGTPMLGYTIYPLVDTYGWETALSVAKSRTSVNTGGVFELSLEPRPFIRALLNGLNNQTAQASTDSADQVQ
ncbi:hypothetical protein [Chenggangzhangella methanolivorans]|uniref:Uncharacterized protein n=1 Tax=Chenggangzhangella methanolivorans TaxID=1437009 RepID=A0A9E6RCG4_9HYPH|nr:hypothetical protein [Chenggangzhangella methanolivorans]QZO01305.1 hypothetical protein K6K41_07355 [Chenggangzhangella methanolivorans]